MAIFVPLLLLGGGLTGGYFFAKTGTPEEVLVTESHKKLAELHNSLIKNPLYKYDNFILDLDNYCLYNLTKNEMYMPVSVPAQRRPFRLGSARNTRVK